MFSSTSATTLRASTLLIYSRPPPRLWSKTRIHRLNPVSPATRTIFSSFPGAILGDPPLRHLTQTKLLPHASSTIFHAISDISSYPSFVPFAVSSRVTSQDDRGYPTTARLKVGYEKFGLEEDWDSTVHCDPARGTIEAKSSDSTSGGLFEVLRTTWEVSPAPQLESFGTKMQTTVKLDIDVKFRNPLYDQMFAQVEGKVASAMIAAFEKRVLELDKSK